LPKEAEEKGIVIWSVSPKRSGKKDASPVYGASCLAIVMRHGWCS